MNRRELLCCIGYGSVAALTGCGTLGSSKRKESAMSADQASLTPADQSAWDISVCGLNCARCKLLEKGECKGCRGPLDRNWSPQCEFRPCAEAKGHRYCFECAEFPCEKIDRFASDGHEHHRLAVENMKQMRALGLEEWIAQQPKPMFCPGWRF